MTTAASARAAGLSEEEVQVLKDAEIADKASTTTETIDADKAAASEAANDDTTTAKADAAADTATAAAVDDTPARQAPFAPTYDTKAPEGLDTRLTAIKAEQKAINAEEKALRVKFAADMLSMEPEAAGVAFANQSEKLQERREALQDEREQLTSAKTRAEVAHIHNAQNQQQAADAEFKAFSREAKKEGIDYANPVLASAFDAAFTQIAAKDEHKAYTVNDIYAMCAEAHALVKSTLGWKPPVPSLVTTTAKGPRDAPQTLAGLPAAAPAAIGDDTMARFNQLDGVDAERFLAGLPAKEVRKLLGG